MICSACGYNNPDGCKFCAACGAPIGADTPMTSAAYAGQQPNVPGTAFDPQGQQYQYPPMQQPVSQPYAPNPYGYNYPQPQQAPKKKLSGGTLAAVIGVPVLVVAIIIVLVVTLGGGSGAKLSGTYVSVDDENMSVTFSGSNKITITSYGFSVTGTYKIQGDQISITINMFGVESPYESGSFRQSGRSIWIDGEEFVKR